VYLRSHSFVRRVASVLLGGTLVVGGLVLTAGPAAAAGDLEVDAPSPLFGSVSSMVPLESRTATFEVRNNGTEAGYLRVSVGNVKASSTKYADAMTLATSVPGFTGDPVTLSSAEPCSVLTEGLVLEPGDSVTVTTDLALADMPGKLGQRSTASFRIRVGLSDSRPGTIAPTQCSPNAAIVDGVPVTPAVTGEDEETPEPDATATPAPDRPIGAEPWPTFFGLNLSPNTVQLLQDWGGLVPAIAFILGSGGFFIAARRRRKRQADDEDDSDFDDPDLDYRVDV